MNSLHGIKIANDEAAVKGKLLNWNKTSKQLVLNREPLTSTFTSRKAATEWARKHGATVLPV
jgi:hypothetical protein